MKLQADSGLTIQNDRLFCRVYVAKDQVELVPIVIKHVGGDHAADSSVVLVQPDRVLFFSHEDTKTRSQVRLIFKATRSD
jgi:hypothetical protein